jgi:hypothetical protein
MSAGDHFIKACARNLSRVANVLGAAQREVHPGSDLVVGALVATGACGSDDFYENRMFLALCRCLARV